MSLECTLRSKALLWKLIKTLLRSNVGLRTQSCYNPMNSQMMMIYWLVLYLLAVLPSRPGPNRHVHVELLFSSVASIAWTLRIHHPRTLLTRMQTLFPFQPFFVSSSWTWHIRHRNLHRHHHQNDLPSGSSFSTRKEFKLLFAFQSECSWSELCLNRSTEILKISNSNLTKFYGLPNWKFEFGSKAGVKINKLGQYGKYQILSFFSNV